MALPFTSSTSRRTPRRLLSIRRTRRRLLSMTVYNAKGYLEPNQYNAYSVNNITAKKNADGSVAVQFGGCDGKISNCLPTMPGWNYMVRLFLPRAEVLNGKWKFPEAQLVN